VKTAVHHEAQLIGDSLWHIQPMELIVQECRQTAVELPCVTGHIEHALVAACQGPSSALLHRVHCNSLRET